MAHNLPGRWEEQMLSLTFLAGKVHTKVGRQSRFLSLRFLLALMLCLTNNVAGVAKPLAAQGPQSSDSLSFGQVYGTAVFDGTDPANVPVDASEVVLAFASQGHRNLVLAQKSGDFIALLEPGKYCLSAYTRKGEPILLSPKQLKCVTVTGANDLRLDILLQAKIR
jgi:hypothetical protein